MHMDKIFSLSSMLNGPGVVFENENPPWLADFILKSGNLDTLAEFEPRLSDPGYAATTTFSNLEGNSLLFLMNLIPRKNHRNRYPNGLQQSYGDHNRLMMLGIDRLAAGDWNWLLSRSMFFTETFVCDLQDYVNSIRERLTADERLRKLVMLSASFHDYGKLYRRRYGLDSYDAAFLVQPILDRICATPEERAATVFCIRNHDIVEHVGNGAVPLQAVLASYRELSPKYQEVCWPALSMIQVAGAASLGNGRLTEMKLSLGKLLLTGEFAKQSTDHVIRLNRLIFPGMAPDDAKLLALSRSQLANHGLEQPEFVEFCNRVTIRNWNVLGLARADIEDSRIRKSFDAIEQLLQIWKGRKSYTDMILLNGNITTDAVKTGVTLSGDHFLTVGDSGAQSRQVA